MHSTNNIFINGKPKKSVFVDVDEAIAAFRNGEMLILIDDEERENEGDLVIAAEFATAEVINFMAKFGRGLVCLSITEERARKLDLQPMVTNNTALLGTPFTESVDAIKNTTTGISAFDRAETIRAIIQPETKPLDLARPGHIFPLIANRNGVLARPGHTEAVMDLAKASGCYPAGVLCEILDEDGRMARLPTLIKLAEAHQIKIASVADLIRYRQKNEKLVRRTTSVRLPTAFGNFQLNYYENLVNPSEYHLALLKGNVDDSQPVLVRIHSECLTGDTFGSLRCDCGDQLHTSLARIEAEGQGILIYLKQEGRGIGLGNKILAYKLQEEGKDTVEANEALGFKPDLREYWFAAQILKDLGIHKVRLITNNPEKVNALCGYGIEVTERVPIRIDANPDNHHYLKTKKEKLGHYI